MTFGTRYDELDQCLLDYLEWYRANETRVVNFEDGVEFLHLACNGRVYLLHLLRDEIVALRNSHTNVTDLDKALDKYTQEYADPLTGVDTITDPMKLVAFLKVATDNTLHLIHMMRTELRNAEAKQASDTILYLPNRYRP